MADAPKEHIERFPPVKVTLPWMRANGQPVTKRLIFSGPNGGHVWRTSLNEDHWKPALAKVGVIPKAESREHAAAREHGMHALRHFYASVLLDGRESIKAVSEYLGHSDPGLTLKGSCPVAGTAPGRLSARRSGRKARGTEGPQWARAVKMPPIRTISAGRGHDHATYFFLPWFFTASMAAFAASGSRYVPPGLTGRKSASSS